MKALTCEMCGNTNLIKEDGVFVCQSCNTKYSVEEAKKMMIDGTVEVAGTVKIDTSSELSNLYEIARRAKDNDNSENAFKYYDMILVKDPNSWEANFYVVYFRAMSSKIGEIESVANLISRNLDSVLVLVKENVPVDKQNDVVAEIYSRTSIIAQMLYNASENRYYEIDISIRDDYRGEYIRNAFGSTCIMYLLGDYLEVIFGETYSLTSADSWKQGVMMHNGLLGILLNKEDNITMIKKYIEKIKNYDTSYNAPYKAPTVGSSSGCYIATAVYGSYNCPEVWTLRRFRDYTLNKTWYGRLFIKSYYAVSPTIVKWFGKNRFFRSIWLKPIDKIIHILWANGVQNTPYKDQV